MEVALGFLKTNVLLKMTSMLDHTQPLQIDFLKFANITFQLKIA